MKAKINLDELKSMLKEKLDTVEKQSLSQHIQEMELPELIQLKKFVDKEVSTRTPFG